MCDDTEEWWKIWRGIDLSFQNWQKELDEYWLEHLKVSKIYTLMCCFNDMNLKFSKLELLLGPFIQSRKCMSLTNFDSSTQKSDKFAL